MAKTEMTMEEMRKRVAEDDARLRAEQEEQAKARAAALNPLRDLMAGDEVKKVREVLNEQLAAFEGDPLVRPHVYGVLECMKGLDTVLTLFQGASMAQPTEPTT